MLRVTTQLAHARAPMLVLRECTYFSSSFFDNNKLILNSRQHYRKYLSLTKVYMAQSNYTVVQ